MTKKQPGCSFLCVYGRIIQDENNTLIYCYQNSDTVITVEEKNMAIEYAMLFTTKRTKQECIHIHVIKLMMIKGEIEKEVVKKKPVRRISSTRLDTEKKME
jgi:hypothetical protein